MSVELTTHILPGYDQNNPMANKNLYLKKVNDNTILDSNIKLEAGQEYKLFVNVQNLGTDSVRIAVAGFHYKEDGGALMTIGEPVAFRIDPSEIKTIESSASFIPSDNKNYEFYAVAQSNGDLAPDNQDAADRHVAGQTATVGEKEVLLTLHDGFGNGQGSVGQNPNVYLTDLQGNQVNKVVEGSDYVIKARVVNSGPDSDAVQVSFYSRKSGTDNTIALSEVATVAGNDGDYVFSSQGAWKYQSGENELLAVCSTISDADQYTDKNLRPSDRHVGQFNVNAK